MVCPTSFKCMHSDYPPGLQPCFSGYFTSRCDISYSNCDCLQGIAKSSAGSSYDASRILDNVSSSPEWSIRHLLIVHTVICSQTTYVLYP